MAYHRPRFPRWRFSLIVLAGLSVAGGVTAVTLRGHVDTQASRPVTLAEAHQLAMVRFNLHDAGTVRVVLKLPEADNPTTVVGLVDYRAQQAVGRYSTSTASGRRTGLLAWDARGLAVASISKGKSKKLGDDVARIVRTAGDVNPRSWSSRAYTTNPLDAALRLVMGLGHDRPDNAQLLAQSGPRHLGKETIEGTDHTIYSGPRPRPTAASGASPTGGAVNVPRGRSPLTYWVDASGRLGRLEARLTSLDSPARWDLTRAPKELKVPSQPWG